jgi:toxin ParE1/3/4
MAHRLGFRARADLDDIWRYIVAETGRETFADRQIDAITSRFSLRAEHPRLGRARDDDLGRGRRSFPADDYIIVYRIVGADVQILRVVHGRRNFGWPFNE